MLSCISKKKNLESNKSPEIIKAIVKFVGFITEHESSKVKIGHQLDSLLDKEQSKLMNKDKLLHYLGNNTLLVAFLHYIFDGPNPIGPHTIYTDGEWVWPSYLAYYIKKYDRFYLPEDFIDTIVARDFIPPVLSQQKLQDAQKFYVATYNTI